MVENISTPSAKIPIFLLIVFLLSGIWHGAKWTFVFWGLIHASFLIFENITKKSSLKIKNKYIKQLFVFVIVSIAWVFFRSPSFEIAYTVLRKLISFDVNEMPYYRHMRDNGIDIRIENIFSEDSVDISNTSNDFFKVLIENKLDGFQLDLTFIKYISFI